MVFSLLILSTLAILNATLGAQQIPIEVQITPVPDPNEVASGSGAAEAAVPPAPPLALDAATLTLITGAVGGLIVAWKKGSSNDNAIADTITNLKESLKATDQGAAENAKLLARVTEQAASADPKLAEALQNCKPAALQNAKEWEQDNKAYYETFTPPGPEDRKLNDTKAKLSVINKETVPTK